MIPVVLTVKLTMPPLAGMVAGVGAENVSGQGFSACVIVIGRVSNRRTVLRAGPV